MLLVDSIAYSQGSATGSLRDIRQDGSKSPKRPFIFWGAGLHTCELPEHAPFCQVPFLIEQTGIQCPMTRSVMMVVVLIIGVLTVTQAQTNDLIPSTRQAIILTRNEQDYLIGEMHRNLSAISSVVGALAQRDSASAAQAAASRGLASYGEQDPNRPKTLSSKLPPAWKPIAMSLRQGFDQLAQGIASNEPTQTSLRKVSQLMAICSGCHANFQFNKEP